MYVARSVYTVITYQYFSQKSLICMAICRVILRLGSCYMQVGIWAPLCTLSTGQENSNVLFSRQFVSRQDFHYFLVKQILWRSQKSTKFYSPQIKMPYGMYTYYSYIRRLSVCCLIYLEIQSTTQLFNFPVLVVDSYCI